MRVPELRQSSRVQPSLEEYEAPILTICVFAALAVLLAVLYNAIRRRVFGDAENCLDAACDAGGRVSATLTSVAVAMQLLWPTDLLQSATETAKHGVSGGFWYSLPILVSTVMFPLLSLQLKTRAPGAKTFLQPIRARFGQRTHLLYCVFALIANAVVTATLVMGGASLFKAMVKDISAEMVVMVMAALFGSYSFVGGLGSTFYVSYFNAVITLCVLSYFVTKFFYVSEDKLPFGNVSQICQRVSALADTPGLSTPEDSTSSYLTFWSRDAALRAAQGLLLCLAVVCCDQATWQNKMTAKPMQGVLGFIFASAIWFAIPTTLGTSAGLAYLAYSGSGPNAHNIMGSGTQLFPGNSSSGSTSPSLYQLNLSEAGPGPFGQLGDTLDNAAGHLVLSAEDINSGLVTPLMADLALGKPGGVALLVMFTMLMMSTGSREVMAVSSIIVYDIYQTYVKPFRSSTESGHCLLCGRPKPGEKTETIFIDAGDSQCCCPSFADCSDCALERLKMKAERETVVFESYSCPHHGQYRAYQDSLAALHRWVVLWVALSIIPLGLLVMTSRLELNWIFMYGAMILVQAVPGIVLSISWVKVTRQGLVTGSISGLLCGLAVNLTCATVLPGGLFNFLVNSADDYSILAGSGACLLISLFATVAVSLATHNIRTTEDAEQEWQKLRDIDNPLRPWQRDMRSGGVTSPSGGRRPTYQELDRRYRSAKLTAYIGFFLLMTVYVLLIPGCMVSLHTMTSSDLQHWLMTLHIWCFVVTALVVILVPLEEGWSILSTLKQKKRVVRIAAERHKDNSGEASLDREQRAGLILK